ncbi:MAG: MFS transporter [Sulfuriflexus sp.]|nr:MFS transporter [Sulfuriflexus sp.]
MTDIPVTNREKLAWILYDFANSGYATVVLTTIYSAYFVSTIAMSNGFNTASATLFWTLTIAMGNILVLFSAPLIGALADIHAIRKKLLVISTFGCILFTALLAIPDPGDIVAASLLVVLSYFMFASGENLIAAFLPELTTQDNIGRLSGYGWSIGFLGGLSTLLLCLIYVSWAKTSGQTATDYVPITMLIVAGFFSLATIPTILWLKERGNKIANTETVMQKSFARVFHTIKTLNHYPDLRRFMLALTSFHAGIYIIIVLAAVYATQVMGFDTQQNIILISVVNITAAIGAFGFGHLQDKLGSIRTLLFTLVLWCIAIIIAWASQSIAMFWLAANLIGIALGASQSASRALIGLFSPPGRYGEFFGLWGMCVKLSAIIGPLSYGFITWLNDGNHRDSILTTLVFFVLGIIILLTINEERGRQRVTSIKE